MGDQVNMNIMSTILKDIEQFNECNRVEIRLTGFLFYLINSLSKYIKSNDVDLIIKTCEFVFDKNADRSAPLNILSQIRVILIRMLLYLIYKNEVSEENKTLFTSYINQLPKSIVDGEEYYQENAKFYGKNKFYTDICSFIKKWAYQPNSNVLLEIAQNPNKYLTVNVRAE